MERRLAAILVADVIGYSRLMGADEANVLAALQAMRKDVFDPLVAAHHGRIVKLMGDGALVEFASAVAAVTCATEVQAAQKERNADLPADKRLELRIGINLGDVMVDGADLYGDGVNVAARLESIAAAGGICVSEAVAAQTAGKVPVEFEDMGALQLKNIAKRVRVFRLVPGSEARTPQSRIFGGRSALALAGAVIVLATGIAVWKSGWYSTGTKAVTFDQTEVLALPSGPTVAVIPFENLSGDRTQDYLADGISEDIVTELGQIRDLNILPRSATVGSDGKTSDAREIGADLGADYVLEGSVRQAGERLRVTSRLSDVKSGAQVWAQAYDETMSAKGLFDLQVKITERVATAIGDAGGAISRITAERARTKPPEHLSSYECSLYQPDLFFDPELQRRVRNCILRVVEEEPNYWRGWSTLAMSLRMDVQSFTHFYEGTADERLKRSAAAARKAVLLNPAAPRAYYVLARTLQMTGDRDGFLAAAKEALALGGDRYVDGNLGYWLARAGYYDLGAAVAQRAIDLNPNSVNENWHRAMVQKHFHEGNYEAALSALEKGRQPDRWWSYLWDVALYGAMGRAEEASRALKKLVMLRPDVTIQDAAWLERRFMRPESDIKTFARALRAGGLPAGRYSEE